MLLDARWGLPSTVIGASMTTRRSVIYCGNFWDTTLEPAHENAVSQFMEWRWPVDVVDSLPHTGTGKVAKEVEGNDIERFTPGEFLRGESL